jgi:succinoglycan biosynthesis transport protein ExoP
MMSDDTRQPIAEIHLKEYLRLLLKHRWLILAVFIVTAVTGTIWTFLQTPIYQASATVLIEPELPKVLNIQEVTSPGLATLDYYRTQYALMTSRPVLQNAIAALKRGNRTAALAALGEGTDPHVKAGILSIEPVRSTQLVLVQFQHPDPAIAAEVATVVAQAYVKYNLDVKLKGTRDALTWLNEQMAGLRGKVEESSTALQNYRVKSGILGIQEQRALTAQKAQEVNRAHLEAQAQRLSIEAKLGALNRIATDQAGAESLSTSIDDPLIRRMKTEMAELQVQRSKLLQTYKEQHPEVLKVDAQIQQLSQRMDTDIKKALRALDTEYKVAKARRGPAAQREGDSVRNAPARAGFEPAALRGRAQAGEGDGRPGRARQQQRAGRRGGVPAALSDSPAQAARAPDERPGRAGPRHRGGHDGRILRHER